MKEIVKKDTNYRRVFNLIDEHYVAYKLQTFYNHFLKNFIQDNMTLCIQYQVPVEYLKVNKTLKKKEYVSIFTPFFAYGELFRAMHKTLPKPVDEILSRLIWEDIISQEEIEKKYKVSIAKFGMNTYQAYQELKNIYCIFSNISNYRHGYWYSSHNPNSTKESQYIHILYLQEGIRQILREYVEKPADYYIQTVPEKEVKAKTTLLYEGEKNIFLEFPVLLAYTQQGQIKTTQTGKVSAATLNKMRKYCNIQEFFSDKSEFEKYFLTLRTRVLAEVMLLLQSYQSKEDTNVLTQLKGFFDLFQQGLFAQEALLFHLKGWQHVYAHNSSSAKAMINLLQELPLGEWISLEKLYYYLEYRGKPYKIVSEDDAGYYLYMTVKHERGYNESKYAKNNLYKSLLNIPLIKSHFTLFGSLGWIDIAYNAPKKDLDKSSVFSYYDQMQYIRLNPLGAHMIGSYLNYSPPKVDSQEVKLDEEYLLIHYKGENKSLIGMLETISKKAGINLYKVDFETVLGRCNSQKEVAAQIQVFKQLLDKNPPKIWLQFFEDLQQKSYQMDNLNEEYNIYHLPDNKELMSLIAKDEFLKKFIIRAEYYNILIPKKHLAKVKKHLKKSGFLIEFE